MQQRCRRRYRLTLALLRESENFSFFSIHWRRFHRNWNQRRVIGNVERRLSEVFHRGRKSRPISHPTLAIRQTVFFCSSKLFRQWERWIFYIHVFLQIVRFAWGFVAVTIFVFGSRSSGLSSIQFSISPKDPYRRFYFALFLFHLLVIVGPESGTFRLTVHFRLVVRANWWGSVFWIASNWLRLRALITETSSVVLTCCLARRLAEVHFSYGGLF